jgi:DNA-directed RNA polymerase III subunit RPC4
LGSVVTGNRQKVFAERHAGGFGAGGRSARSFNFKSKVKAESTAEGDVKADYSSSDESDGQRMDVEYISLLDAPSEDEGDLDQEWGAGAPIRIPRSEHVDRQAMVNTESSAPKGKAELKAMKDKEMTFETEIKIKEEPEDEPMLPPSSPELTKRRVKVSESPEARRKQTRSPTMTRRRSNSHKKKPIISTAEDKEEFERLEADRLDALKELGGAFEALDMKGKGKEKQEDADGDIEMDGVSYCSLSIDSFNHLLTAFTDRRS